MNVILDHPANAGVIRSLCRNKYGSFCKVTEYAVRDPSLSFRDPYISCGSHPDIVSRVWDELGRGLPPACRRLLLGGPVLVHPDTGVILAVCHGTSYCLRLPEGAMSAALQAGCTTSHRWGDGTVTDLSEEFGPDWVFGCGAKDEAVWCRAAAAAFEEPA